MSKDNTHAIKKAINQVIREKGRFPVLQEMCDILNFSAEQTKKYMMALAEDGYLKKVGNWYMFPDVFVEKNDTFEGDPQTRETFPLPKDYDKTNFSYNFTEENGYRDVGDQLLTVSKANIKDNDGNDNLKAFGKEDFIAYVGSGKDKIEKILDENIDEAVAENIIDKKYSEKINEDSKRYIRPKVVDDIHTSEASDSDDFSKVKAESTTLTLSKKLRRYRPKWFKRFEYKPKKKKKKLVKSNSQVYGMPVYIVQFMMGIIGSGAAVISVYYTTIWLFEFLPWYFALLLSTIMVFFAIAAFETIILFMSGQVTQSKITKVIISIVFSILFVIVTLFSITSTIAGQYNRHVANLRIEAKSGDSSDNASYKLLKEEKIELRIRLSEYRKQVSNLTNILGGMSDADTLTEKSKVWKNTQYRLYLANKNMKRIGRRLNNIRKKERLLIAKGKKSGSILVGVTTKKKILDFYGWLSGIFLVGRDKIQFIMSLFPAIFVDIISPTGIALALFLRNKYKR